MILGVFIDEVSESTIGMNCDTCLLDLFQGRNILSIVQTVIGKSEPRQHGQWLGADGVLHWLLQTFRPGSIIGIWSLYNNTFYYYKYY